MRLASGCIVLCRLDVGAVVLVGVGIDEVASLDSDRDVLGRGGLRCIETRERIAISGYRGRIDLLARRFGPGRLRARAASHHPQGHQPRQPDPERPHSEYSCTNPRTHPTRAFPKP